MIVKRFLPKKKIFILCNWKAFPTEQKTVNFVQLKNVFFLINTQVVHASALLNSSPIEECVEDAWKPCEGHPKHKQ